MSEFKEMPTYEITKAKMKNEKLDVNYDEVWQNSNYRNEVFKKCENFIHPDLKYALDLLKPHLAVICEMPESTDISSTDITGDEILGQLSEYIVTGYSKSGRDENESVCIIGQKFLKSGKIFNIVTPSTFLYDETGDGYVYCEELQQAIQRLDYEVDAYLFGEKWGMKQLSLDFDDQPAETAQEPKRRGRKKKAKAEGFEAEAGEIPDVEFEEAV